MACATSLPNSTLTITSNITRIEHGHTSMGLGLLHLSFSPFSLICITNNIIRCPSNWLGLGCVSSIIVVGIGETIVNDARAHYFENVQFCHRHGLSRTQMIHSSTMALSILHDLGLIVFTFSPCAFNHTGICRSPEVTGDE